MLTLNETFVMPGADHAWSVINDLNTLVPCVPGACVTSVVSPQAVKAEIEVRMGAMGMTFIGRSRSSQSSQPHGQYQGRHARDVAPELCDGDITICLGDGQGTIDAIANVGGKAAGMGEGVIVNVLTNLVKSFSANVANA